MLFSESKYQNEMILLLFRVDRMPLKIVNSNEVQISCIFGLIGKHIKSLLE